MKQKKMSKKSAQPAGPKRVEQQKAASAAQQSQTAPAAAVVRLERRDLVQVVLFALLTLVATLFQTKQVSLLLAGLAVVSCIGKKPLVNVKAALGIPLIGFLGYGMMQGLAAIYSPFDSYAVAEYYKFIAAFSLATILLMRFEKKHVRGLLWGFVGVCAVIAVLSIDAASRGVIFRAFNAFSAMVLDVNFNNILQGAGYNRVNGLYNDANITASIFALGAFVSMYLVRTEQEKKKALPAYLLLGILAQAFFLSMSRAAILCFGLALLVWLFAAAREERIRLFFLMAVSAVVTVALSIPAMKMIGVSAAAVLLITVLTGFGIFALDRTLSDRLTALLEKRLKLALIAAAALVVAGIGYVVIGMNVHGTISLDQGESIIRIVDLEAGEYSVSGQWEGDILFRVVTQTKLQQARDEISVLFEGPLDTALFEVPQDENRERMSVHLCAEKDAEIISVIISDGTEIPLSYPLLPTFLSSRLQDNLLTSDSTFMRIQYDMDAWKLFCQAPLMGHGLGSTQALYSAVQPFYYESLYAHNHVLQVMSDMGLLGAIPFLTTLLGTAWLLLRRLKQERDSLAGMLLVCWVMMNAHGLLEINFSIRAYQCLAYILLVLVMMLYGGLKEQDRKQREIAGKAAVVMTAAFCLCSAVFGGLLASHYAVTEEEARGMSSGNFMEVLQSRIKRDVFVQEENKLSYIANAVLMDDPRYIPTMERYVQQLRNGETFYSCINLARYYYLPLQDIAQVMECSREGIAQYASNPDAWDIMIAFYRDEVLPELSAEQAPTFVEGVVCLGEELKSVNDGREENVNISEKSMAFVDLMREIQAEEFSGDEVLTQIHMYSNSPK